VVHRVVTWATRSTGLATKCAGAVPVFAGRPTCLERL